MARHAKLLRKKGAIFVKEFKTCYSCMLDNVELKNVKCPIVKLSRTCLGKLKCLKTDNYMSMPTVCNRSLAMRQQIMDDRRRAMMNEMYNRQGSSHGTSEEREA